jgi:hypothetical protein
MRWFPQLSTGALSQYPVRKTRRTRTALTAGQNGDTVKLTDPDAEAIEWELRLTGLTDHEWASIESLFDDCEGGLKTFGFLDPFDNLLAYSEDLEAAVWRKDALLQIQPGMPDPTGGASATKLLNAGQTPQGLSQTLEVPANLNYCFSAYVRSGATTGIRLEQRSPTRGLARDVTISPSWSRVRLSGNLHVDEQGVMFSIIVPAGGAVEVYGLQVEAQPAASEYRKTAGRGGVYPKARFADDELRLTSTGPDCHETVLRITTPVKNL